MEKTTDYDKFKLLRRNRLIKANHVAYLKKQILEFNFLH